MTWPSALSSVVTRKRKHLVRNPSRLMMSDPQRFGRLHLHDRHHAPVLMGQDMTMQHIETRIVDEPATHLEVTGNHDGFAVGTVDRLVGRIQAIASGGNREHVPPDSHAYRGIVAISPGP